MNEWDKLIFGIELAIKGGVNFVMTTKECEYLLKTLVSLTDKITDLQAERRWIPVSIPPNKAGNYLLSDGESVIEESWDGREWGCAGGKYWRPAPLPPEADDE